MVDPAEAGSVPLIRVEAASYRDALERIQSEYGPDFRIVRTGVVNRGGLAGMVGGRAIEVFLAPAERPAQPSAPISPPASPASGPPDRRQPTDPASALLTEGLTSAADRDLERQVRRLLRERESARAEVNSQATERTPLHARVLLEALERVRREGRPEDEAPSIPSVSPAAAAAMSASLASVAPGHSVLRAAGRLMHAHGFSSEVTSDLSTRLRQRRLDTAPDAEDPAAEREARSQLGELLRPKLPPCVPIAIGERAQGESSRVVVLVGPTGVGKTTTIAKLSAPLRLVHGRRVALVTLDTFRLGAVEQIRRYGEIVGLEVHTAERPEDLARIVAELSDHDLVFVDTAGSSPKNDDQLEHVRRCITPIENAETHLCVSASSARESLLRVARRFRSLSYDRLLITKTDEAEGAGQLVDLFQATKVPVSYIASGQGVPEDIATATAERLERVIMGETI